MSTVAGVVLCGGVNQVFASPSIMNKSLKDIKDDENFWKVIREQFIFPDDYIYLNTGGIGAVPNLVLNEIETSMIEQEKYPRPGHDHNKWLETKQTCTGLLAPECKIEELALVSTATEGINIIINGLPLKSGDEIITSTHEHPALHVPLLNKWLRNGVAIKAFEPDLKNGAGNLDRISELITGKTRLIFLSHITCTTGQIMPLKEIGQLAKKKNIWFAVDGAQAAGSMPMNIKECQVDFYTASGHKWTLGPKRTGVLYVKEEMLDVLKPMTVGAYSDNGYDILKGKLDFQPSAQRYEYGTQNESLFRGMKTGVDFIKAIGLDRIKKHNRELAEIFYDGLLNIPDVEIVSPEEKKYRSSIISFRVKGKDFKELASFLTASKRIRVRVVSEAGLNSVRASFHVYNNKEEVEKIIQEIRNFIKL